MSKMSHIFVLFFALCLSNPLFSQRYKFLEIRNCQQELRTMTFEGQVSFFRHWACGRSDFRKQRILNFSPDYKVDTAYLERQVASVRRLLPGDFASSFPSGYWYDNVQDEPGIWFTVVFAGQDDKGHITAYAAYRVLFEGDNAHIDEQRMHPAIKNIDFIVDKVVLQKLAQRIKTLPETK